MRSNPVNYRADEPSRNATHWQIGNRHHRLASVNQEPCNAEKLPSHIALDEKLVGKSTADLAMPYRAKPSREISQSKQSAGTAPSPPATSICVSDGPPMLPGHTQVQATTQQERLSRDFIQNSAACITEGIGRGLMHSHPPVREHPVLSAYGQLQCLRYFAVATRRRAPRLSLEDFTHIVNRRPILTTIGVQK